MSEIVERVARAIYEDYATKSPSAHLPWDDLEPFSRQIAISNARAAISALLPPTEEMVEAGLHERAEIIRNADTAWDFRITNSDAHVFRAMITAALAEQAR